MRLAHNAIDHLDHWVRAMHHNLQRALRLKDECGSGTEPVNVRSQYRSHNRLACYDAKESGPRMGRGPLRR
jgi:hypothetical protein